MTITIDYDNDQILIQSKGAEAAQYRGAAYKLNDIERMLEEIFNRLDDGISKSFEISLQKQDDGRITGIGGWWC